MSRFPALSMGFPLSFSEIGSSRCLRKCGNVNKMYSITGHSDHVAYHHETPYRNVRPPFIQALSIIVPFTIDWGRWVLNGHKGFLLTKDEVDEGRAVGDGDGDGTGRAAFDGSQKIWTHKAKPYVSPSSTYSQLWGRLPPLRLHILTTEVYHYHWRTKSQQILTSYSSHCVPYTCSEPRKISSIGSAPAATLSRVRLGVKMAELFYSFFYAEENHQRILCALTSQIDVARIKRPPHAEIIKLSFNPARHLPNKRQGALFGAQLRHPSVHHHPSQHAAPPTSGSRTSAARLRTGAVGLNLSSRWPARSTSSYVGPWSEAHREEVRSRSEGEGRRASASVSEAGEEEGGSRAVTPVLSTRRSVMRRQGLHCRAGVSRRRSFEGVQGLPILWPSESALPQSLRAPQPHCTGADFAQVGSNSDWRRAHVTESNFPALLDNSSKFITSFNPSPILSRRDLVLGNGPEWFKHPTPVELPIHPCPIATSRRLLNI
ncbi:hypothetical protein DFP72DRAFT_839176 [Ephemerocybe angulata]|uniref:Uncharacterized protein n=1 Tax=Ephemerocybe angulata TaxID=980116 RepID=A0A8H6MG97_9AGAR|nr:hypothetical protein DFP72DRAFT_839176 [Tulosesus angulatus]